MEPVIWQYWETKGLKPAFVDGLYALACANAGVRVIQVTPETLSHYLPDLPEAVHRISEIAHKADIIRARLIHRYGGMWLDSDALVMRSMADLFDAAQGAAFLGFNDTACLDAPQPPNVRVNCFVAPANSPVMAGWVAAQDRLLKARGDEPTFTWTEVGTELLDPVCVAQANDVRLRPFAEISPVPYKDVAHFDAAEVPDADLLARTRVVMLSNRALHTRYPALLSQTVEQMAVKPSFLGHFVREAQREARQTTQ